MSSIVVSGDTSGTITIAAPAVAGTNTLTLPANTGTVLTTASTFGATGPAFSAYLATTNQSITTNTYTKITLNAETFDTASCFDSTTNYRFTPTVAGYYQINGEISYAGTGITRQIIYIYKNGSSYAILFDGNGSQYAGGNGTLISMNGSTDYIELYTYMSVASGGVVEFGSAKTYMTGFFARAA